ncbi:hypothetical protein [Aureimonas sp. AU4]|uniref:hypothetical protein n=1 Tax=Aureimonas sp. AU4 TaxID=1638163 RepID=UPI0007863DF9|nr:hypothetical protein [Aureimonas sp. AU4]
MPFDVMRSVQALQDQVARGNSAAIRVQAMLLRRFTQSFLQADPAVWQDARNKRAAVLFTLSGGPPELLEGLHREALLGPEYDALVEGSLRYVRNDLEGAYKQFSTIDPMAMEPVLGGQISLVLGQIQQFTKPAEALEHLDRARLLAPGGLIEEAALRLEALLSDEQGRHAEADRLARRYFDRYFESTYAANFEARFASIMTDRARGDAQAAMVAMSDVVAGLPRPRQDRLFLSVARRSVVEGNLEFGRLAAERALLSEDLSVPDRMRAQLYETASSLAKLGLDEGRLRLDAVDRATLHPEDALLLDAAYRILDGIGAPDATVAEASLPEAPVLARAEQALSAAAGELESARQ